MRGRVSFSPEPITGAAAAKSGENNKGSLKMNRWRFSPARLLRQIGTKVEVALWFVTSSPPPRKVSSATLAKSRSYAEKLDCQRAEAIEDCIDFFNSFSSLQRSNSVTSTC